MSSKEKTQSNRSASNNYTRRDSHSSLQHSAVHKPVPGKEGNGGKTGKGGSNK